MSVFGSQCRKKPQRAGWVLGSIPLKGELKNPYLYMAGGPMDGEYL